MTVRHNRAEGGRRLTLADRLLAQADDVLRTSFGNPVAARHNPGAETSDGPMDTNERRHAGRLMRVNHAGEVAAQALYRGQALTARLDEVCEKMDLAAREEIDHLAWCEQRLRELDTPRSALGPLWYAGSFAIGAIAGLAGDRWSLGFVAETETQVVRHIDGHLGSLPEADSRSRAILEQMREDEARHSAEATSAGGAPLPPVVQRMMQAASRVMTRTAYWI